MSNFYYYELNDETYQIEADSYSRIGSSQGNNSVQLSHPMNAGPIDVTYPQPVSTVESLGDTWSSEPGGPSHKQNIPCPIPDINGNSLYLDFNPGFYFDNVGTCRYRVSFVGGGCITEFYRSGSVIRTLDSCPPISDDPRNEGCSACCRELLPIVRRLRV